LRPSEFYALRWENIHFENGRRGTLLVTYGKTKAARRMVPLTPRVRAVLEAGYMNAGQPEPG
jgi:integrase